MTSPESFLKTQPACYLAYAPQGPGLECALTYYVEGDDVHGWWIGLKDLAYESAFFKLEGFFSTHNTVFYATRNSDIYDGWRYLYSRSIPALDAPISADDDQCHKLVQLEDAFINEWLWIRDGSDTSAEETAYADAELAVQQVNIKYRMLGKFRKEGAVWTHESHNLSLNVVDYVAARWPLEYGKVTQ